MNANDTNQKPKLDLAAIRTKLSSQSGKKYWRSLEEVAELPEFQLWLEDEFPNRSTILQINRRDLMKFMGASMALAGLSGCRSVFLPEDKVVPYVRQPEELVPGKALFYASAVVLGGYGTGVLVEQHEGRPTLIVGNTEHPSSLGALDSISQAEILGLYDPDRSDNVVNLGDISTLEAFDMAMDEQMKKAAATGGAGLRLLTGSVTSPTMLEQITALMARFPNAKWHAHEAAGRGSIYAGATLAFGRPLEPVYDFSKASVIVSLDSDFLNPVENPGSLAYARQFSDGRRIHGKTNQTVNGGKMNRLYAFESTPGLAGTMADHRYAVKASAVAGVAGALAAAVGVSGITGEAPSQVAGDLAAIAQDLIANPGAVLVVAGKHQPAEVHAIAFAINEKLGAVGKSVKFVEPIDATADTVKVGDLKSLVDDLKAKRVDQLLIIDANPAYDSPVDLAFGEAVTSAKFRVRVGQYEDETSKLCDWHVPMTHTLEQWGDVRGHDGSVTLIQPLIAPLYIGVSGPEFISRILGKPVGGYDLVRAHWSKQHLPGEFEKNWRVMIHDGLIKGSALAPVAATLTVPSIQAPKAIDGLEICFRPDPTIYDGRFSNNGWLQELPKPLTKMTWDNVIHISPNSAKALGLELDKIATIDYKGQKVDGAVWVHPGQPDDAITVHLGYGRTAGGIVATVKGDDGGGFNAYALRTSGALAFDGGVSLSTHGDEAMSASTQGHGPLNGDRIIDDRDIIHDWTLTEFTTTITHKLGEAAKRSEEIRENNLYPDQIFEYPGAQWGMTVDMNTCIGCNACVTACQAENNIPVVGKIQVARHREMHWIRIDRYYSGTDESPAVTWQPVACVQCEKAPCEPVCPVAATVHSHEGLNQMVYNRCVGTRYCSNNCPYKVRHFNYFNFSDNQPNFAEVVEGEIFGTRRVPGPLHVPHKEGIPLLKMLNNPDVTVRGRGIMEKCTYCVQRINEARTEAKKTGTEMQDGDIVTACQQACPTNTIVFGNIADPNAEVTKLRHDPRAYLLLEELQTRPRTSHLARLRNPNPAINSFPHYSEGHGS